MKIALVHDFLSQDGGAERVLAAMQEIWPEAPTFVSFYDAEKLPRFKGKDIRPSFLQRAPFIKSKYQWYVGLMPAAIESFDLSSYDVVISSASAFAKGPLTRPDTVHICYCHTPTRYLWSDTHSYVEELRAPGFIKALLPPLLSSLRQWDRLAAERPTVMLANSRTVQNRIQTYYKRPSDILYPPVDTGRFHVSDAPKTYFLTGGRLVAYKRFDMAIEACNRLGLPLKIFGTGPMEAALRAKAGPTIEFLGSVPDADLPALYAGAKAFLHPQEEDFGLTAIEAMASGRPVIAYRKGGAKETIIDGKTGILFDRQDWETLAEALATFARYSFNPQTIRAHALQYDTAVFAKRLKDIVCASSSTADI